MSEFDWRTQTLLKGTVSRVGQWVRGDCPCGQSDALLYDSWEDETLLCVDCSRVRATAVERTEICDECGGPNAWRDPLTGRNEYFCGSCHAGHGTVFQNRWATKARESRELNVHAKALCVASGYGTDCKGEVKPRGGEHKGRLLCNKHAGKKSLGPDWH